MEKKSAWVAALVNGFLLQVFCMAGTLLGFMAYHAFSPNNQLGVQIPVMLAITIVLFVGWSILNKRVIRRGLEIGSTKAAVLTTFVALFFFPAIFYPLHYLTQGYVATFTNVVAIWVVELPLFASITFVAKEVETGEHGSAGGVAGV